MEQTTSETIYFDRGVFLEVSRGGAIFDVFDVHESFKLSNQEIYDAVRKRELKGNRWNFRKLN